MLLSSLIAVIAFVVFAPAAVADPGDRWDRQFMDGSINGERTVFAKRFVILLGFASLAVLDRETGRVWERSPDTLRRTWLNALGHCYQREVGDRKGWRLPTIEELASLVDPSNPGGNPDLPPGHPFFDVQSADYWSATTVSTATARSTWFVDFSTGAVLTAAEFTGDGFVWCVRGGQGVDGH